LLAFRPPGRRAMLLLLKACLQMARIMGHEQAYTLSE